MIKKAELKKVPENGENEISCQWKDPAFYIGFLPLFSVTIEDIYLAT